MNRRTLLAVILILGLLAPTAAAAPLAGPCVAGGGYNPACDANQDGSITVTDIQLTAGHWNQSGTFVSDSNHTHLGQTWTGANNPLKLQGAFGAPDYAPVVLSNNQGHGLSIPNASIDGIYIGTAGAYGLVVNDAAQDGVYVGTAGNPSTTYASTADFNGFEVAGAEDYGLYIGRAELATEDEHRPSETGKRLVPHDGAAQPGDYVTIIYSGPMQVKVAPDESPITAGTRLTAAADGQVRPLRTRTIEGMLVTEGAPVLGVTIDASKDGLVWVLVNP